MSTHKLRLPLMAAALLCSALSARGQTPPNLPDGNPVLATSTINGVAP